MRIDSHQHFWKYNEENFTWLPDEAQKRDFGPKDLEPILKANQINGCVFVQVNQTEEETSYYHQVALEHSFIKGIVGWTHLFSPDLEENLQEYAKLPKLKGFRHIVQGEPVGFMKNEYFVKAIQMLTKYNFTYDILVFPKQLKDAVYLAQKCSDSKLVLDHLGKPDIKNKKVTQWSNYIKQLAQAPNVFCKISGLVTEADTLNWKKEDFYIYLDFVLNQFGSNRLMYGSDWPVCISAASYEQQLQIIEDYISELSPSEKQNIMGQNAIHFYNL